MQIFETIQNNFHTYADKKAVAFSGDGTSLTYGQLDELSGRVRAWLGHQGVGREDVVLIRLPRGCLIPAVMLGVWKNGSACIVCETTMPQDRIRYILSDSGAKCVIGENEMAAIMECAPLFGFAEADGHDSAYIVYTSGTSGNPKGVIHEYGNLAEAVAAQKYDGVQLCRENDVFAINSPLNFVAANCVLINILARGGTVLIVDIGDVKNMGRLTEVYASYGVTSAFITPSLYRTCKGFNPQMEWMIIAGEPCVNIYNEKIRLYNLYNLSEAGRDMLIYRIDRPYEETPVGRNQGGEEILLLDENGAPVPDGASGEIAFRNSYVRGYLGLPEQTAAHWRNGLFFTGDIGKKLPDGNFILQGRNDDMIKINGNRIEPEEIANAAKRILGLSWAAAKGFITETKSVVALYYTDDVQIDAEAARTLLAQSLASYMLPSYFVKLNRIPLLPNGKLDKKMLALPELDRYRREYAAPENELEKKLLAAFEAVLETEHLGVNDDFYELGGDSLRAISLITALQDPLLNVSMLYKHRTVRRLAEAMQQEKLNEGKPVEQRDADARGHDHPLLPMQYHLMDLQMYRPSSTIINLPILWRSLRGCMDRDKLMRAFDSIVRNHPALQSVIRFDGDEMFLLHYDPGMEKNLTVELVTEEEFSALKDDLIQPFKLINAPLYRFRVFETER